MRVNDQTHEFVDTNFNYNKIIKMNHYKIIWKGIYIPNINFSFRKININNRRIIVLIIPAAKNIPTSFKDKRYIKIGSSKVNLQKYPEREMELRTNRSIQVEGKFGIIKQNIYY